METVLITGANGFLGAHLTRELYRKGFAVRAMIRAGADRRSIADIPCEIFEGAIDNKNDIDAALSGIDFVIHAASVTTPWGFPFSHYERINYTATRLLADACIQHQIRKLVYVSTANTLAPGTLQHPGTELSPFTLFSAGSAYIDTKYLAQQYILEQTAQHQLPAVIVNPTFMIGPGDFKPSSGRLLLYGMKRSLLFYPPGGKNFVDVADVCTGVIAALEKGRTGECYLLAGENLSYREFFRLIRRWSGQRSLMISLPGWLLRFTGMAGSLIGHLRGRSLPLNRSVTYMACIGNYYSAKKAERELDIRFSPAGQAIHRALDWFKENNYF